MDEICVRVGIKTLGRPVLEKVSGATLLKNMLIGDGFHWQKTIESLLPGEIEMRNGLVNVVPLEKYLECVVGSEMNPKAPAEFLKAHAVISRSWSLGKILKCHSHEKFGWQNSNESLIGWDDTAEHQGFDVCSDDHCQRYQGLQPIEHSVLDAIRKTAGEVLTAPSGRLVDARFSKCCGGKTETFRTCWQNRNEECLESVDDPWCALSDMNPGERGEFLSIILKDYDLRTEGYGFHWKTKISKIDIERNLFERFGRSVGHVTAIMPVHRGRSGRIDLLRIIGTNGSLYFGKELWIRRLLSPSHLYSSAFEIEDFDNAVSLTGKGWGHGVGLCQIGAARMATKGFDYRKILSFYYPGSEISKYI